MSLSKKISLTLLFSLLTTITLTGSSCQSTSTPDDPCADAPDGNCSTPVTLTIWHPFEDRDIYDSVIADYEDKYPNVTIAYKKMEYDTYEKNLVNALAAGEGPDIFQIHNDWLPKHYDKISPMPKEIMTLDEYKSTYVDVAVDDFIYQDNIYSLPLYVDTLALYYNTKLLEKNNISSPPTTWQQLVSYVHQITEKTTNGQDILTSGVSLGTSNNINRSSDILYAMMLQKGTLMTSPDNASATFALSTEKITGEDFYPGTESLDFYTSFANPDNVNYTWNNKMLGSLEAFEKGYTAMTINYSYQQANIDKFKSPDVRYKVTYLPRIETTDDPISYANFWSESVNKQSKYSAWAWHFIKYMSEKSDLINTRSGHPTAIRKVASNRNNIFNEQSLYAKSFYKVDSDKVDQIFGNMIDDVSVEKVASQDAITKAQNEVTALMINQRK